MTENTHEEANSAKNAEVRGQGGGLRRWFFGQSKPYEVHGGYPPMPRPPEDRGKPC